MHVYVHVHVCSVCLRKLENNLFVPSSGRKGLSLVQGLTVKLVHQCALGYSCLQIPSTGIIRKHVCVGSGD